MNKLLSLILRFRNACLYKWFGFSDSVKNESNFVKSGTIIRELSDKDTVYCTSPVLLNRKQFRNSSDVLNSKMNPKDFE